MDANTLRADLKAMGLDGLATLKTDLSTPQLVEEIVRSGEGKLADSGAVLCLSGAFTGRTPKDKFSVVEEETQDYIDWGEVNQKLSREHFDALFANVAQFLSGKDMYVFHGFCGADEHDRLSVRFLTQKAWHNHFVRNMFIVPSAEQLQEFLPEFTVINACEYTEGNFAQLGLHSENFVACDLSRKIIIIGGTHYAGEMKKGIFGVMNYLLTFRETLPMHCSANVGPGGDVCLFFGLSGTGKTTLSASHGRALIGDDEHGWSVRGVYNLEGGCYAKTIDLCAEREPEIWNAIRFGSILENVVYDENSRQVDFSDPQITQNTRVSYPIEYIENYVQSGCAGHPQHVIFLTCDAFGILPPVALLTPEHALYHFLSGYTAKVAGTEYGIDGVQVAFSACFGSPFLPRSPLVYAQMLKAKLQTHNASTYLVNTGWSGGGYGAGKRMDLRITRRILEAIFAGEVAASPQDTDPVFGFAFPTALDGVPSEVLTPRLSWSDADEYDKQRLHLAQMFKENFAQFAVDNPELVAYGPQ